MSGVARYHAETASPHPQGAFVLYEDYAALLERIAEADATIASLREAHMEMTRLCLKANDERKAAEERIAALEADSARLDWLAANLLGVPWTHPSGQGCRVTFDVAKDCRVTVYEPRQPTADELRAALDAGGVGGE